MPKFIDSAPHGQCALCRLVAGDISAARVDEDELTLAFMDLDQVNPGHVLVAVRRRAATLLDLPPDQDAAMRMARRVALATRKSFDPPCITRLHVVSRHAGDGIALTWPSNNPRREPLDEYAARRRSPLAG